jgi:hypothetical protein
MTINLMYRRSMKLHTWPSVRTRKLQVEDFDNAISEYKPPVPLDMEIEVSEMPKPKRIRMATLKVESRKRARFESVPVDLYVDI